MYAASASLCVCGLFLFDNCIVRDHDHRCLLHVMQSRNVAALGYLAVLMLHHSNMATVDDGGASKHAAVMSAVKLLEVRVLDQLCSHCYCVFILAST